MPDTASEIVNLRAVGTGVRPSPELPEHEPGGEDPAAAEVEPGIYDRAKLAPGHRLRGPAIVTEFDSTTVVLAGYEAAVDRFHNILIRPEGTR